MKRLTLLLLLCLFATPAFATSPSLIQFLAGGIMDSDGSPLTAGTAYFYEAGYANDPAHTKNVWTDFAKTATATYIVLGGTGHAPGGATVFGEGLYDVVIKDADGAVLCMLRSIDIYYLSPENFTASGTLTADGDLFVSDDATIGDDLIVTDTASVGSHLNVGGNGTVGGDLTVSGAGANFRNAIKAVDGAGSGIDADLWQGRTPASLSAELAASLSAQLSSYLLIASYTAADVLSKLLTVDGTGSTLDADTTDTFHASATPTPNFLLVLDGSGKVPSSAIPSGAGAAVGDQIWSTPGTYYWSCPTGISNIRITGAGAGGGGGGGGSDLTNVGGAGGGGGAWAQNQIATVTAGYMYTIIVGTGGQGGDSRAGATFATAGATGGATSISNGILTLAGGSGGAAGEGSSPSVGGAGAAPGADGGAGGYEPTSTAAVAGGNTTVATGGVVLTDGYYADGGGGGASLGNGGKGSASPFGASAAAGSDGSTGGGGGGAGASNSSVGAPSGDGGDGGNGYLKIEWGY